MGNLLGWAPMDQKFDDEGEPALGEYAEAAVIRFIADPIGTARHLVKD